MKMIAKFFFYLCAWRLIEHTSPSALVVFASWEVADEDWDTEEEECDIHQVLTSGSTVQRGVLNNLLVQIQTNENPTGMYPTFAGRVEAECRVACSNASADHRLIYTAAEDFVGPAYTRFKKRVSASHNPKTRKVCYSVFPPPPSATHDTYMIDYDPETPQTVVLNVLENDENTYQSYWEGVTEPAGVKGWVCCASQNS